MFEEAEHLKLAEDTLRGDERLEHIGQFLECHAPAIARVRHRPATKQRTLLHYIKLILNILLVHKRPRVKMIV